jgi:hypothetical protein
VRLRSMSFHQCNGRNLPLMISRTDGEKQGILKKAKNMIFYGKAKDFDWVKYSKDLERELGGYRQYIITEAERLSRDQLTRLRKTIHGFHEDDTQAMVKTVTDFYGNAVRELRKLDNTATALHNQNQNLANELGLERSRLTSQREDHENEKRVWKVEFRSMEQHFKQQAKEVETKHEREIERHEMDKMNMDQSHKAESRRLKDEHKQLITNLEHQHEQEKVRMISGFQEEKRKWQEEQNKMRQEMESLAGALVERDSFTPIPDHQLQTDFADLAKGVEQLARLKWKLLQADWTDELLNALSPDNIARLQRQILQDTIWMILFEYLFCSPFRVFGEDGEKLEHKWNKDCGQGMIACSNAVIRFQQLTDPATEFDNGFYIWPEPTVNSERWRYNAIIASKEAVEANMSPIDPRVNVRKGFRASLKTIREELAKQLGKYSDLTEETRELIKDVPLTAARLWLAMGTQRCRLLVVMPGSTLTTAKERAHRAKDDELKLNLRPQLWRCGNVKGQNLEEKTLFSEGDIQIL